MRFFGLVGNVVTNNDVGFCDAVAVAAAAAAGDDTDGISVMLVADAVDVAAVRVANFDDNAHDRRSSVKLVADQMWLYDERVWLVWLVGIAMIWHNK